MSAIAQIRAELRSLVRELGLLDKNCFHSGLSLTQAHLLNYLAKNGQTSFAELCRQLNMDKASLSRTLSVLTAKRYVLPCAAPGDRRQKNFHLTSGGEQMLRAADSAADSELASVEDHLSAQDVEEAVAGLRALRIGAFRRNVGRQPERICIDALSDSYRGEVDALLFDTFCTGQNIPPGLLPVAPEHESKWWIARSGELLLGVAASWRVDGIWHWGRFAVDSKYRRLGVGQRLALASLRELLVDSDEVIIEARETTVKIISRLGGKTSGPPVDFYGAPVTPMRLVKDEFAAACASLPAP